MLLILFHHLTYCDRNSDKARQMAVHRADISDRIIDTIKPIFISPTDEVPLK